MNDFADNAELLRDFLTEAAELLADLDNHLIALEQSPRSAELLNAAFRSFHTIKGGAGFLGVTELVKLCHLTENVFDCLRTGKISLDAALMDLILAATAAVRAMFDALSAARQPQAAPTDLLQALEAAVAAGAPVERRLDGPPGKPRGADGPSPCEPNWQALLDGLVAPDRRSLPAGTEEIRQCTDTPPDPATQPRYPAYGRRSSDDPRAEVARAGRRESDKVVVAKEATIRIDTSRLDHVLNLAGEIGLTKNRLMCLRTELLAGRAAGDTLHALDEVVGQLDRLVADLQNAVMKTRMQPVGRLFQKYPRLVRDLARQLGKDVELELNGEDTELDRMMIEELSDPLLHLVRNALDHGLESSEERTLAGKAPHGSLRLSARPLGDHIVIEIADDGRGIRPELLRRKAIEKGLLDADTIRGMDDRQALQLIFLPGFSTKDQISSVSGRGVGMDVVKTNIQKLNGRIDIASVPGAGTTITLGLPLTLAILPVLVVRVGEQPFALPLTMVREIIRLDADALKSVSGKATVVIRDEVLPVRSLASMLGRASDGPPGYGVLLQTAAAELVVAVDGFVGRDDVVIKPLEGVKAKGVAGATLSGDGSVVLVLDIEALLPAAPASTRASLLQHAA